MPVKKKIERLPALPPAETNYHRIRKRIHLICFAVFVLLPFLNVMRFDIPKQRFWFAGYELWINEFAIVFFSLMFLMFCIVASAIVHGRIYCSYACPQMIFSEWAAWLQKRFSKPVYYAVLAVASVFLAFVFTSYFVEPRDLAGRLLRFDVVTAGGLTGAIVTLITFLDFALVRQKFCTTVCPYGYLQGMLQDKQTLLVVYQDEREQCIECKKCVRVCEMGIDIRKSPYQIECVHCGDCIDACEDVLRRIGRPGLIHYRWGEKDAGAGGREPLYKRLGFRDAKRVVIALVLVFYASGLAVALSMRHAVLIRLTADRTTLYTVRADGRVANTIRMTLANRSSKPAKVRLWAEGLAGAEVGLRPNPLSLSPGETVERRFDVVVAARTDGHDVNRFRLMAQSSQESAPEAFEMTFIMPVGR